MFNAYIYLRNQGVRQVYYFRRKIPRDVCKYFKRNEIKLSLKTSNKSTAQLRCAHLFDNADSDVLPLNRTQAN